MAYCSRKENNKIEWLAGWDSGRNYGKLCAEERIIKLLEEHTHPEAEADYLIDCDLCERYYGVGLAIALIKGEK